MGSSKTRQGMTRRALLDATLRVGAGAATFALLGQRSVAPVFADSTPAARVKVLVDDLVDRAAEFERGQARGVAVRRAGGGGAARGGPGGILVSAPARLPFDATHLGLHWLLSEGGPDDISVSVRTRKVGRDWSAWQPLEVKAVADRSGAVEVFAALADGGRGRLAQYRVEFGPGQASLDQMVLTAINSADGPRVMLPAGARTSFDFYTKDQKKVSVVTREGWGCDESLRFSAGAKLWPEMYVPAKKLILHHTAGTNGYTDGAAEVRAVYVYHAQTLGWGDIGYNVLVDKFGKVYEGRHGRGEDPASREILSADVVAGHVLSHNYGSVGVSAIGNYDTAKPTAAMLTSIDDVFVLECGRHCVVPTIYTDFLKSNDLWHLKLNNISGHYESDSTKCPGRNLKSYLSTLKTHVSSRLNGQAAPKLVGPTAKSLSLPASLLFSWSGGTQWRYCLEGWRRKPNGSEDLIYLSGYDQLGADVLSASQAWSDPTGASTATFSILEPGHYTMHVRAEGGTYEANLTYLVT